MKNVFVAVILSIESLHGEVVWIEDGAKFLKALALKHYFKRISNVVEIGYILRRPKSFLLAYLEWVELVMAKPLEFRI